MKARMISFNILKEICIQKGYSNLVLQKKLELAQERLYYTNCLWYPTELSLLSLSMGRLREENGS